jgi:predicted transcriptional regulator
MRLDPDIVRAVLMKTAELPFDSGFHEIEVEGCSEDALNYHIMILEQAGLIAAEDLTTMDGICWQPKYLTYEGNEFLSAAERDTVWAKAKTMAMSGAKTASLEALKIALSAAMKAVVSG